LLDRALKACDDSVRRDPNHAAGHICLGDIERRRGAYDDSLKEYQRARELDPDDVEVSLGLARTYTARNELEPAEANYKQAIKISPDYYLNYMHLGNFYFNSRTEYAEALKTYQKAIDQAPDNHAPHIGACGAQIFLGNYDEAVKACNKSISLRPTFQAYSNLGVAFLDLRQYSNAAQSFERAIELNPGYYKPVGHLARAYYWMGNRTEATRLYLKAIDMAQKELTINPRGASVHAMLARYHAMLGTDHRSQAFFHLGVALQEKPEFGEYQCIAAVVHNQFSERTAAMRYLEKAVAFGYSQTEIAAERELDNLRADQTVRTP
jgi:eukaryotic-like serine/threonine-protein kinase